jgi:2-polyprenyl-3-methyl-5-hydroxy-6-metoxy-1,4-benzoquinol methylase
VPWRILDQFSSKDLAQRTGTHERCVREWLAAQAASGYVTYDEASKQYYLSPEQSFALAQEDSPAYIPGAFQIVSSVAHKVAEAFRTGSGVGWHEHHPSLFEGTERFPPELRGQPGCQLATCPRCMVDKLRNGAKVADVGCGFGASTILMAQAFPQSKFYGYDYHQMSIERAKERARRAGVLDRIEFRQATAKDYPDERYDMVAFFDCLHDMGDPVGAAKHARSTIRPDGTWMIVEPFANDDVKDDLNPIGRVFYSASTMVCTPASMSQEVGAALGAQAGEKRMREVANQGGFSKFRRAAETPFNLVYEARA